MMNHNSIQKLQRYAASTPEHVVVFAHVDRTFRELITWYDTGGLIVAKLPAGRQGETDELNATFPDVL